MVHLRRGETLRRYLQPGLEDGKTFVFWGRNYNTGGIPGPERPADLGQPAGEDVRLHDDDAGYKPGQARFGNAVYTYKPDFSTGDYREGVVVRGRRSTSSSSSTRRTSSPRRRRTHEAVGHLRRGLPNGLVLRGKADVRRVGSRPTGADWHDCGQARATAWT